MEVQQESDAATQSIAIKKEALVKKSRVYDKQTKKVQEQGFTVLSKEIELENMVAKEEEEKEKEEDKKMEKKIKQEQDKADCLEKSFEEREIDDEFIETEKNSMADQAEVKVEMAKKIKEGRWKLKKKLELMKAKAKTHRNEMSQKLNLLRQKMAKQMLLANRNGNEKNCIKGRVDHDYRETYCNENFVEDWTKNSECKSDEDFCYTCCENEFGLSFVTQRDNCYNICDKKPEPPKDLKIPTVSGAAIFQHIKDAKPEPGYWQWAPKVDSTKQPATQ